MYLKKKQPLHLAKMLSFIYILFFTPLPSLVGSVRDLKTGGHLVDARLNQYSFRGLIIAIATKFIPFNAVHFFVDGYVEKQESMDRCISHCDITETVLKMALNTLQSINPSSRLLKEQDILPYTSTSRLCFPLLNINCMLCRLIIKVWTRSRNLTLDKVTYVSLKDIRNPYILHLVLVFLN